MKSKLSWTPDQPFIQSPISSWMSAAVSSAGEWDRGGWLGKKKEAGNCIWDTPAVSGSVALLKTSLLSLAVWRKSLYPSSKPHNEGSRDRRQDLLFWPSCCSSLCFPPLVKLAGVLSPGASPTSVRRFAAVTQSVQCIQWLICHNPPFLRSQ